MMRRAFRYAGLALSNTIGKETLNEMVFKRTKIQESPHFLNDKKVLWLTRSGVKISFADRNYLLI
jgi:hypothetical protein